MSILKRISLIRKLTNGTRYDTIGDSNNNDIFLFDEKNTRFVIVSNIHLAKKVLLSENIEAVNHLSSFIKEEDKSELYLYYFYPIARV